jgi:hypothetical protein
MRWSLIPTSKTLAVDAQQCSTLYYATEDIDWFGSLGNASDLSADAPIILRFRYHPPLSLSLSLLDGNLN